MTSPLVSVCYDWDTDSVGPSLRTDYFGLYRCDENGSGAATYALPYGEWIRLFRRNGLVVEDLIELRQPADARNTYYVTEPEDWFRRWPGENIWVTRRIGD